MSAPAVAGRHALAPEMELILHCARPLSATLDETRIAELLAGPFDWSRLVELAAWHRVLYLVHAHLRGHLAAVPAETAARLARAERENGRRVLQLCGELLSLVKVCTTQGIRVVAYKGVAQAAQVYGGVALRHAGDIDVVVRPADAPAVRSILAARGYVARHELSEQHAAFMLRERYGEEYQTPSGCTVEVHWAFTNGDVAFPIDLDELFGRLEEVSLGGARVPTFAADDLLLLLSVHGAKHRWNRLEWIAAVAELARRLDERRLEALIERAAHLRVRRRFLLALALARDLFDVPLPHGIAGQVTGDTGLRRLASEVLDELLHGVPAAEDVQDGRSLPNDVFQLRLGDSLGDRLRLLLYRATTPTKRHEWRVVTVRDRALPLHTLTRPFALVVSVVPALLWMVGRRVRARGREEGRDARRTP